MAYKVSVKEHQAFLKAQVNNKATVANYVTYLDKAACKAPKVARVK